MQTGGLTLSCSHEAFAGVTQKCEVEYVLLEITGRQAESEERQRGAIPSVSVLFLFLYIL